MIYTDKKDLRIEPGTGNKEGFLDFVIAEQKTNQYDNEDIINVALGKSFKYKDLWHACDKQGNHYLVTADLHGSNKLDDSYLIKNWMFANDKRVKEFKAESLTETVIELAKKIAVFLGELGRNGSNISSNLVQFSEDVTTTIQKFDPNFQAISNNFNQKQQAQQAANVNNLRSPIEVIK